ncbi:MAG: ATP-binding protein [Pseudomonadota bacterium]
MIGWRAVRGGGIATLLLLSLFGAFPSVALARTGAAFDVAIAQAKAAMLADPGAARAQARAAEQLALRQPASPTRDVRVATAEWLQGEAALRQDDTAAAQPLIERALSRLGPSAAPTKLRGDLLMSRGTIHAASAEVAGALADYQAAHNIFRDIGETRSQSIALITIGTLFQQADDNPSALKYFGRALDIYGGDPGLSVSIYNNRGFSLKDLKRYPEAARQFDLALGLARQLKSPVLESQVLRNIARLRTAQGDLIGAESAVRRGRAVGDSGAPIDAIAAEVALQRGTVARARALIEHAFAGADLTTTDLGAREAHYTAYKLYTKLGERGPALVHLQAMKRLDDQVWKLSASTNTALMAAKFDSVGQEAKISDLRAKDAARRLAMEKAQVRFQRILFGSVAAAALVVMGLLAAGLIQTRRSRARLALSNTALEKALAAKTEFLATTSHEIRTPLNGILGMTQVMLADANLAPATRDRLGIVNDAGLTMRALVDDILDVAKMETGNLTMESLPFDLKDMLADVTRIWGEQARAKGLRFDLDLGDCPRGIVGDAGRLRQIVFNLLSNAVKFTAAGGVTVRAACAGDRLTIAITDTGIGIDPAKHAEIFESFKQADGGTTRQFGGTGLGLAICKNIARGMTGEIRVASALGQGATFTLDIPFTAAEIAAPVAVVGDGALLIVDKNPIARAMLKAVLEPRAGTIVFAANCAEAADRVAAGGIVRVLIDEAAARADGADPLAAIAALAAVSPGPVAVLWAGPDDAVRAALLASGVSQVIGKPVAGPALAAQLYDLDKTALVSQAA